MSRTNESFENECNGKMPMLRNYGNFIFAKVAENQLSDHKKSY